MVPTGLTTIQFNHRITTHRYLPVEQPVLRDVGVGLGRPADLPGQVPAGHGSDLGVHLWLLRVTWKSKGGHVCSVMVMSH